MYPCLSLDAVLYYEIVFLCVGEAGNNEHCLRSAIFAFTDFASLVLGIWPEKEQRSMAGRAVLQHLRSEFWLSFAIPFAERYLCVICK